MKMVFWCYRENFEKGEHYEDYSDYLKSWINALENDYSILYRAVAEAEKSVAFIVGRYIARYQMHEQKGEIAMEDNKIFSKEERYKLECVKEDYESFWYNQSAECSKRMGVLTSDDRSMQV